MKIGLSSDWHISQYSSILRNQGNKFSLRLEQLIKSINWAEALFAQKGCAYHICLGDAFDKAELNADEISAVKEIKWENLYHYFIVGNHEMASSDLASNTTNLFSLLPNSKIFDSPTMIFPDTDCSIFILPYILNSNRKSLDEYLEIYDKKPDIILSHNDIKGIQLGKFISTEGFSIDEIQKNCSLFVNGHLHNCGEVAPGIYNIGNLCGQNFSEDAFNYKHNVWILDTEIKSVEVFENPFAFNFYKIDFTAPHSKNILDRIGKNAVLTVKCFENEYEELNSKLKENDNIITMRFIIEREIVNVNDVSDVSLSVDHLAQFESYVKSNLGTTDLILSELQEVLK